MTNNTKTGTPEWEALKVRLKKDRCLACGATTNLQMHHITYNDPKDIDFVTLCGTHHRKIHFQRSTGKAWSLKTRTVFKRLCWLMAEFSHTHYINRKKIKKAKTIEDLYSRLDNLSSNPVHKNLPYGPPCSATPTPYLNNPFLPRKKIQPPSPTPSQ